MVQRGEADAVISNHLFGNFHSARYGVVDTGIVFQPAALFFATGPGRNAEVLAAIDRSVEAWRSGADPAYAEAAAEMTSTTCSSSRSQMTARSDPLSASHGTMM